METKERKNTNIIPRRKNAGNSVERIGMKFGEKKYNTQFTSTGKKIFVYKSHAQTRCGCDVNTDDNQERDKETWIESIS